MEGREAILYAGAGAGSASPYFMQQTGVNMSMVGVPLSQGSMAQASGQGGSGFQIDNTNSNYHQLGMNMCSSSGAAQSEVVKKKRGRPRKYGPDKTTSLVLTTPMSKMASEGSNASSEKRKRGRPPGTGRKQMLASLGGWMNSTAGSAFTPQILFMDTGEDVAAKILQISSQRRRAICILSGSGTVSSVTLRQPASSDCIFTYKDHFRILSLSGSYLVSEEGRSDERTGGLNISLSSRDGHILGGVIDGPLIADSPVQVVTFSFIYDGSKSNVRVEEPERLLKYEQEETEPATPDDARNILPSSQSLDLRNPHAGIDLMLG